MRPGPALLFSFWVYPPLACALLYLAGMAEMAAGREHRALNALAWVPAGLLLWTLIEYLLHRFVFHPWARYRWAYRLADRAHGGHHREPRRPERILASPALTMSLSGAIFGLLWTATGSLVPSSGVMAGIWAGFLCYEAVHYAVHTSNHAGLLETGRRRHFHHHFVDDTVCFGVTSPLWDLVFGTTRRRRAPYRKSIDSKIR